MKDNSRVVNCRGCGGSGRQAPCLPTDFPKDCQVCGGTGKVRIQPDDTWCGRCGGTGKEKVGIPGLQTLRNCHICGGVGIIQI